MHREYRGERAWRGGTEDDELELWGRDMERDDWLRGSYGPPPPRRMGYGRGPAWLRGERYGSPHEIQYDWDYQDREGWQRSPNYDWQRQPRTEAHHWHGRTEMRGFQRSDERIREDICSRLSEHPGIDTADMDVAVHDGEVTLEGTVDHRWEKRMAEDVAEAVPGVRDVHNRLRLHGWIGSGSEIHPAMQVVGIDGHEIGRVRELQGDRLIVARATGPDVLVPLPYVQNTMHEQVILSKRADELEVMSSSSAR